MTASAVADTTVLRRSYEAIDRSAKDCRLHHFETVGSLIAYCFVRFATEACDRRNFPRTACVLPPPWRVRPLAPSAVMKKNSCHHMVRLTTRSRTIAYASPSSILRAVCLFRSHCPAESPMSQTPRPAIRRENRLASDEAPTLLVARGVGGDSAALLIERYARGATLPLIPSARSIAICTQLSTIIKMLRM